MLPTSKLKLSDLSQQRRVTFDLGTDLRPEHSVAQAVELFLHRARVPDPGAPWNVFSRGRLVDQSTLLADLDEEDTTLAVVPEVTAG
jgi:hypothetical protein